MYNRTDSTAGDARRRLSGAAASNAEFDEKPEDFCHHETQPAREYDDYDEEGEHDDARSRGLVDYGSSDAEDDDDAGNNDGKDDGGNENRDEDGGAGNDGDGDGDKHGPSIDDLFAPGELEQRLADEAAGIDPYADEFYEAATEVDEDDLERRRGELDDEIPEISEEERAATDAIYAEIRRKAEADQAAMAAAYANANAALANAASGFSSSSSSSAGSDSTSTGSDWVGPAAALPKPASDTRDPVARNCQTPPPQDLAEPKTPDLTAVALTTADLNALNPSMIKSLEGAPRGLILRTLLGRNHGTVTKPSKHSPPTPFTSPESSPAPDFGLDEGDNAPIPTKLPAAPAVPANRLKRTFNADRFLPDGMGGYFALRAQRHVSQPWELSHEENARRQEKAREQRRAQAAAAASMAQPSEPARSPSVVSEDVDMAGYDTESNAAGDSSPSRDEGTSSQTPNVERPVNVPMLSPTRARGLKRARAEDDIEDGTEEKRRRVETGAQPESPTAVRTRAGRRTHNEAGPSTAATRNYIPESTTTTTAPAVVETNHDTSDGHNEMPLVSLRDDAVAGPSNKPASAASPKRLARGRGRAAPKSPKVPTRRSTRIREKDLARAKAAVDARPVLEKAKTKRGRRSGNGRA